MPDKDKKPGGQPGNKNAFIHGFYTPRFKPEEKAQLTQANNVDVLSEIALLRVYINRLVKLITLESKPAEKDQPAASFTEKDLAALNTLTNMTIAISTHVRTHHLINGKSSTVEKSIQEALEEIRLELGL